MGRVTRVLLSAWFCTSAALKEPQEAAAIRARKGRAGKIRQPPADPDPTDQLGDHRAAVRRAYQVRYRLAARDS
jgi:hypothetical protein